MSKINKYACKEEIEEFLDELKLENHVRQHGEIKAFVLEYMLKNPPGKGCVVQVGTIENPPELVVGSQKAISVIVKYECPRPIPLLGLQFEEVRIENHYICGMYDAIGKKYVVRIDVYKINNAENTQPQKETKMNLEQIATELTEMGVTDFWGSMFMHLANEAGYSGEHDVKFEKLSDSIAVSFGECQCEMDTQRVVIEALNQDLSINTYTDGAVFLVPVTVTTLKKPAQQTKTQKEIKMSNEQTPTDTDFIWKKFRGQLEAAKLSQQSTDMIMRTLREDPGLKKPTAESVLLCTKSRNVTNVFYSHTGKLVTLTDAEDTYAFEDGETLSYGAGHRDAFFIADTTKVKTFEEKMIYRHVGVPKITLNLSNGKSIELPFKKEYLKVTEDAVVIHLNSDVAVSLSNKDLNSLTGWALTDLNEVEKSRFFVNGTEYTLEEYNRKLELWKKQGIINPSAGSWADIE